MTKRLYIGLVLILLSCMAQAAPITVPWECGFEEKEAAEISNWVLNPNTPNAVDQWCVGKAIRSSGKQSLYISTDGGATASHGATPDIVIAYRLIDFPAQTEQKEYDVTFDVRSPSNGQLYVYFDYASSLISGSNNILQYAMSSGSVTNRIPSSVLNNARFVYSQGYSRRQNMAGTNVWRAVSIDAGPGTTYSERLSVKNAQKQFALVFVWINTNHDPEKITTGACIDNVQISSAFAKKPENLKAITQCEDSSITFTWTGGLNGYEVGYRRSGSQTWRRYSQNPQSGTGTTQTFTVGPLEEGRYDFRVRGWKKIDATTSDTTGFVTLNNVLLYCPENSCVNYIDLANADCGFGPSNNTAQTHKRVDYGPDDVLSLHTVNIDPDETDLRTGNKLRLVPENAMASVRLGNWWSPSTNKTHPDNEGEAELTGASVHYSFTVDSAHSSLLLIRYAMVLENPNHSRDDQPAFRITVTDENGEVIGESCGAREFYCPTKEDENMEELMQIEHWTVYPKSEQPGTNKDLGLTGSDIYWKDWTTMGINLMEMDKQTVHIYIESVGCKPGAHYGYGYFTMSCASASIATEQCGSRAEASATAPDGFSCEWYDERDTIAYRDGLIRDPADGHLIVVSRETELKVDPSSDATYVCHLFYSDAPDCGFELKTHLSPRNPHAMFSTQWEPYQCENLIQFIDASTVYEYMPSGEEVNTGIRCDYCDWSIRSITTGEKSQSSNPRVDYYASVDGDSLEVTQIAYMADGECESMICDTIWVPAIATPDSFAVVSICDNQYLEFNDQKITEAGSYVNEKINRFGCDSIIYLDLSVNPTSKITTQDTISDLMLPYEFHGLWQGRDTLISIKENTDVPLTKNYQFKLRNSYDCDSTINIRLTIVPIIDVDVDSVSILCADEGLMTLGYEKRKGDFDSLVVEFDEHALKAGLENVTLVHDPYNNPVVEGETFVVPFPQTVAPDRYRALFRFYQHPVCGEQQVFARPVEIQYASSIIEQKWNDVLVLLNKEYNGGFNFIAYQWFKNGLPIEGATEPFLHEPLDFTAEYNVLLMREDSVTQFSCSMTPVDRSSRQITPFPTYAHSLSKVRVRLGDDATLRCYSALGTLVSTTRLKSGESFYTMPSAVGAYIVQIIHDNGEQESHEVLIVP